MSDKMLTGMCIEYDYSEECLSFDQEEAEVTEHQFELIDGRNNSHIV
jgi:hypothetical protein